MAPKAVRDVDHAVEYYEAQQTGLGEAFDREVTRTILRICKMPTTGSRLSANTKICRTHRFPYGVIYQRKQHEIVVISVQHLHRDPNTWK